MLATAPFIYERFSVEQANDTYEVVVPELHLQGFENWGLEEQQVMDHLKNAGVHAFAVEPETIDSLANSLALVYYDKHAFVQEHPDAALEFQNATGFFIAPTEGNDGLFEQTIAAFGPNIQQTTYTNEDGQPLYFIEGGQWQTEKPITYNMERIDQLKSEGFGIVLRISNAVDEYNNDLIDQMAQIRETYGADQVLFTGEKVLGMPKQQPVYNGDDSQKEDELERYTDFFKEQGFSVLQIEFYDQEGFQTYGYELGNRVLRLHSLDLYDNRPPESYIERAARGVKERNMRVLFVNMFDAGKLEAGSLTPEGMLQNSANTIRGIHQAIPDQFEHGKAQPFAEISQPIWAKLATVLAIAALTGLLLLELNKTLAYIGIAGIVLGGAAWAVLDIGLIAKALALFVGMIVPVAAVGQALNVKDKKDLILRYVIAAGLALAGSWIIVVLLYGNEFLVKIDEFRGVKILYVAPIVLIALYLLFKNRSWFGYFKEPVRYYQVVILVVIAAALSYYLMRSGNSASVSGIELQIRAALESLLYVRPRTKEFLIGYPIFIFAMYLVMKGHRLANVLYIGAVIGFMSLVNTFTHLHIPLGLSFLRVVYGLVFGLLIGLALIYVWKLAVKGYKRFLLPRWNR